MIVLMNSLSNFGISVSLLRNSIFDKNKTLLNAYISFTFVQIILLLLAFIQDNFITKSLNLSDLDYKEHICFYISIIALNIYLFNKSVMNAEKNFKTMLRYVFYIVLIRILAISLLYWFKLNQLSEVLILIFILPFLIEIIYYLKRISNFRINKFFKFDKDFFKFISFSFRVFIVGSLFSLTDKLVIIKMKSVNTDLSSLLAFSFGFLGIVTVLNFSFQNYFLNKINPSKKETIISFLENIKKYSIHYFLMVSAATAFICLLIYSLYDGFNPLIYTITVILILKTAITSYFGFKNLLVTSFDMLNDALVVNIFRLFLVYISLQFIDYFDFVYILLLVSLEMIACEYLLNIIVKNKLKSQYD